MIEFTKKNLSILDNIGDRLCTPDNYFDMQSSKGLTVVGGGVWNIEKLSNNENAPYTILWAAGKSVRYPKIPNKIKGLRFLKTGIRDILDLDDTKYFLPCVSCLNERVISPPTGNKTLVFTNANEEVSLSVHQKQKDYIYLNNACSIDVFLEKWAGCDRVITNSYHGIYWSLLTGRKVAPYGYSSKFTNVTALFGIDFPKENLYSVSNRAAFESMIGREQHYISAKNYEEKFNEFKELNTNFARSLSEVGVLCVIKKQ